MNFSPSNCNVEESFNPVKLSVPAPSIVSPPAPLTCKVFDALIFLKLYIFPTVVPEGIIIVMFPLEVSPI